MYKSAKVISQWSVAADKDGEEHEHEVLQNETQTKLPPLDDWQKTTARQNQATFLHSVYKPHEESFGDWQVS